MTARTAWRLAGPRAGRRLIAASVAVAGALVLYVLHLVRATLVPGGGLAGFVIEPGLRVGVIAGTLLLLVPVLGLVLQALRTGSVARDRRLAALRLAGLTPGELRAVSAVEAGSAAAVGGVLAGVAYLVLFLVAGVLPPAGARVVAAPDWADGLTWLALVPVLSVGAGAAGAVLEARRPESRPGRPSWSWAAAGTGLMCASALAFATGLDEVLLYTSIAGLVVFGFGSGPWIVLGAARVLERRGAPESLLAARRLRADPRSPGRVAGVLVVCGAALSVEALIGYEAVTTMPRELYDERFYITGHAFAAAAMVLATIVAVLTLVLGTADTLRSSRRPLAALTVFGIDQHALARVVLLQLVATVVPSIMLGAAFGGATMIVLASLANPEAIPAVAFALLLGTAVAVVVGLLLTLVAAVAVRGLRPLLRAAADPRNLRAA